MVAEFVGGYLTNSLALISDAGHMLSDSVALGLSLSALIFGERAATANKTFGYKRFEILAALLNGLVLIILAVFICFEAVRRISEPVAVVGKGMIIISTIGLIVNIVVAWILSRGEAKHNLNVKSAFMHVIGDLLGSVGAIMAALLIIFFGWTIADPIASMVVSLLILFSGWNILKEAVNILMEGKPSDIDPDEVKQMLLEIEGVTGVHDLHIWLITSDFPSLTAHLTVNDGVNRDGLLEKAVNLIQHKFGIKHITIQIEGRQIVMEETCKY